MFHVCGVYSGIINTCVAHNNKKMASNQAEDLMVRVSMGGSSADVLVEQPHVLAAA
jgi:hypothetical protein